MNIYIYNDHHHVHDNGHDDAGIIDHDLYAKQAAPTNEILKFWSKDSVLVITQE